MKKKLKLRKETLRVLNNAELDAAAGGTLTTGTIIFTKLGCPPPVTITIITTTKPSAVDGCPSQWCPTLTLNTSVINPGAGGGG